MTTSSLELAQQQKMFLLSFTSEVGAGITNGDIGFILKVTIEKMFDELKADLGHWELIWGPVVYQTTAYGPADNVMYVAREKSDGQIAIAIAGTNPNSIYDWVVEDWHIEQTVPWFCGTPPAGAALSKGSSIALNILTALSPRPGALGGPRTLVEFLTGYMKHQTQKVSVATTGHSLGGAISPLVALWLSDIQPQWDPETKAELSTYAFAGPTAANRLLAEYADERMGGRIIRVANALDTSPLGWSVAGLEQAKFVYQPTIPASDQVYENLSFRQLQAAGLDYTHFHANAVPLAGSINYKLIAPGATPYENYQTQSHYQHLEAYFPLLHLENYISYQQMIRAALAPLAMATYLPKYYRFLAFKQAHRLTAPK